MPPWSLRTSGAGSRPTSGTAASVMKSLGRTSFAGLLQQSCSSSHILFFIAINRLIAFLKESYLKALFALRNVGWVTLFAPLADCTETVHPVAYAGLHDVTERCAGVSDWAG